MKSKSQSLQKNIELVSDWRKNTK